MSCCPPRDKGAPKRPAIIQDSSSAIVNTSPFSGDLCEIPGGTALVGTDQQLLPLDEEGPLRRRKIKPFKMMQTAVTNQMFAQFVDQTGFVTEAERYGWSFVFFSHLQNQADYPEAVPNAPWWRRVEGACWRQINGPGSEVDFQPDHPALHISWNDALAFAKWAGGRLPTEPEWEHAARGGLEDARYPWGDQDPNDSDFQPCNIWQGRFPDENSEKDGFHATAPAKSFQANGYGLYNMCGNAWEWTSDPFKLRSLSKRAREQSKAMKGAKVLKGGSYLCHASYCHRYRIAARTGTTPDSTTAHQGFRLVF